jgi:hypothetical protein
MDVRALIGLIKQRRQDIAESMVDGHCVNFESYQRLVGQSMGLNETLQFINQLLEEERRDVE